jgi:ComF family protein
MLARLLRSLFPGACLLCDGSLPPGQDLDLCAHCRAALPWNSAACGRCGLPLAATAPTPCESCCSRPPPQTLTIAPLLYREPVARWVRQLKDHMGMVEGRTLGLLLAEAAARVYDAATPPDLLVPVPLTAGRLARRGHNQAIVLAAPVARRLGIPLLRSGVRRLRRTPPQRGLPLAARLENVAGAFGTRRDFTGRRVAIVDDVMTTGATTRALALVLLDAGAAEVHVLCAARAARIRARVDPALP